VDKSTEKRRRRGRILREKDQLGNFCQGKGGEKVLGGDRRSKIPPKRGAGLS